MQKEHLLNDVMSLIEEAKDSVQLENARVKILGKSGVLTNLMKELGSLSLEEKKERGAMLNEVKVKAASVIDEKQKQILERELAEKMAREKIDVTLPVDFDNQGKIHPLTKVMDEAIAIFAQMGFEIADGPDIEDDFYNFSALNIPDEHPARQSVDTFYLPGKSEEDRSLLLRTHTSPVQIRTMMNRKPPLKVIAPGRVFRCDSDQTHTPNFHQIEGFLVDKNIHMGHLKFCLAEFCRKFFGIEKLPVRFRPSFFPFTEPSAEMDIGCKREKGELIIGEGDGWLEILGCGMIHPQVLINCGLDPEEYQGFAFGMGVERIAMLKYGISDLRLFYETDVRWLKHYGFHVADYF